MQTIRIADKCVGEGYPTFIVAEIGVNHNQDIKLAKKLIDVARDAGADAVKFQTWKTENVILKETEMVGYQKKNVKKTTQFEMLKGLELPLAWHFELKEYAENSGLVFFSTMEDVESVDFLLGRLKIPLIKVGSGDLTNYPLLRHTAKFKVPMILSTGMSTLGEIDEAVRTILGEKNEMIVICQCTTEYPCPYDDVNLRAILSIKEAFKTIVGFSDHSLGIECAVASVALGAKYLEKHLTLDRRMQGPDHKASIEPQEFKRMVQAIRNVEEALGDGIKKPSSLELKNRELIIRRIVAARDIAKGERLGEKNIAFKKGQRGLEVKYYRFIEGKVTDKFIPKDQTIDFSHIS